MIVLGISGPGANSSSALIKNGKLISLIEEERITRIKTAPHGLPFQSATLCLNEAGIDISKVDYIAWGWDCNKYQKILKKFNSKLNKKSKNYKYNLLNTVLYDPKIIKKAPRERPGGCPGTTWGPEGAGAQKRVKKGR